MLFAFLLAIFLFRRGTAVRPIFWLFAPLSERSPQRSPQRAICVLLAVWEELQTSVHGMTVGEKNDQCEAKERAKLMDAVQRLHSILSATNARRIRSTCACRML
jgi:hypothetical protein